MILQNLKQNESSDMRLRVVKSGMYLANDEQEQSKKKWRIYHNTRSTQFSMKMARESV